MGLLAAPLDEAQERLVCLFVACMRKRRCCQLMHTLQRTTDGDSVLEPNEMRLTVCRMHSAN